MARTIIFVVVGVISVALALHALSTGKVFAKAALVSRANSPVLYSVLVGIYVAIASIAFWRVIWP